MGLLRFLLAITVVLGHSSSIFGFQLVGGALAVQAFYIISGFYMTLILNEKYVGKNSSYKLFISNRLLRLFPIYWTVLLLTILYSVVVSIYSKGNDLGSFSYYADYWNVMSIGSFIYFVFTNLFLFLQDTVMFLSLDTASGNLFFTSNFHRHTPALYNFLMVPQAWTIGVEIAFYIIAPFLVRRKLNIIIPLILLSLLLRAVLYYHFNLKNDPWTYRFFPTELVFFLLGIVSYHAYKKLDTLSIKKIYLQLIWLSVIGATLFHSFLPIPHKDKLYLFGFFITLPFVFILTKNWKKDAYIGELSYPIYISHILLFTILKSLNIPITGSLLGITLSILTVGFSLFLTNLVTKRIERIRQKRIVPNR
ncbi:acyltransferase family protein [Flavobacterium sangjuense]|uniref:Acyltransferase 3 domain-containing protein n=1 Tax=Flavobacterium sangjuense TaxID=2518177 RepID=A0A4P7PTY2_9FLAO|nr:acyltransferase [Flavobacterium sangjuense]QBZ97740.1 hypothetical protein GS03_01238 [Flavobacterium sangjuense]